MGVLLAQHVFLHAADAAADEGLEQAEGAEVVHIVDEQRGLVVLTTIERAVAANVVVADFDGAVLELERHAEGQLAADAVVGLARAVADLIGAGADDVIAARALVVGREHRQGECGEYSRAPDVLVHGSRSFL